MKKMATVDHWRFLVINACAPHHFYIAAIVEVI
jgi:hypothetical protein